jgi:hypothetical protein
MSAIARSLLPALHRPAHAFLLRAKEAMRRAEKAACAP